MIAGLIIGIASCHMIFHSVAPSTSIASNNDCGISRRKLHRIITVMGMAKPTEGRMMAHNVSYKPIWMIR